MMDASRIVLLAVCLLLPCKTAIGGEIACEVDNPHGHCESRSELCVDEHDAEQSSCTREQTTDADQANANWVLESKPECPCNSEGWSVSSASEAARCRPDVVNVTFHQHDTMWYTIEVYWKYTESCGSWENVVGVQVKLENGITCANSLSFGELSSRGNSDCCYCIATNHTVGMEGRQNFTLLYRRSTLNAKATVETFPTILGSGESYATSSDTFPRPTNCYDPRLPADLARCGIPLYDPPMTFPPTYTSISNADTNEYSEMNARATLSWDPPNRYPYPNPTHYYVRIKADSTPEPKCSGDTHCFKITNNTEITFTHLNASKEYYITVGAYHRCSGTAVQDSTSRGCGDVNVSVLMQPSTNSTNGTVSQDDSTSSDSVGNSIAIGVSVAVICILGTIVVAIAVCLFVYCRPTRSVLQIPDEKLWMHGGIANQASFSLTSPTNLPLLPFPCNPYTGEQNGSPADDNSSYPSVLVVYSDKTHEKEKMMILQTLVGSLRQEHGIWSTCHDYFVRSDSMVYKTADYLKQASVVLCVCNRAFTDDWNSERPPPVINTLKQIVAANISSGGNLSNYATVFMNARDKERCIPHDFFKNTRQFLIDDMEGIVQFVRTVPRK